MTSDGRGRPDRTRRATAARRRPHRVDRAAVLAVALLLAACAGAGGPAAQPDPSAPATSPPAAADEQISFDSDGLTMAGDLYLPDGPGPHPAVVLVHGSGPVDRHATTPAQLDMPFPSPVTVFADLAAALRDGGYAVLTYDKRTCGPFNDCSDNGYPPIPADLTVETFVTDAGAAVAYLRSRDDVRPDAVAVAGHSQGGSFVPPMLIDDPELAAGVMLATAYDPIDEILEHQDASLARQVRDLRSGPTDDTTMIGGASAGFWRSWMRMTDGIPALAGQVEQPLLVLGGRLDANVPPAQLQRWRETLTGDDRQVVTLECVSHALNCLEADDLSDVTPADIGTAIDPAVGATLVEFLDGALR